MADGSPSKGASGDLAGAMAASSAAATAALDAAFADDPELAATWESLQTKTAEQIRARSLDLRQNIRISRQDIRTEDLEIRKLQAELRALKEHLKLNVKLPFLVANIQEVSNADRAPGGLPTSLRAVWGRRAGGRRACPAAKQVLERAPIAPAAAARLSHCLPAMPQETLLP